MISLKPMAGFARKAPRLTGNASFARVSRGFSLVELMVSVVVLAILVGIAVPAYRTLTAGQRVRATIMDLHSAFALARSEAIKRNRTVILSPVDDGWAAGWGIASPEVGQPDILSHIQTAGVDITGPDGGVVFTASGRITTAAEFQVTSLASGGDAVSCLALGLDGRASSYDGEC